MKINGKSARTTGRKKDFIVFDLGGVLIAINELKLMREFRAFSVSSISANRSGGWNEECHLYETGKINTDEFIALSRKRYRLDLTSAEFKRSWNAVIEGESKIASGCLKRLRRKYVLCILSNTNPLHFNFIRNNLPVFNYIDRFMVSYKIGLLKPDPEIFAAAQRIMLGGRKPFLYIDDSPEHVRAARNIGWRSIGMTSVENLEGVVDLLEEMKPPF